MFFLGLLVGTGAYFIALLLWHWTEKFWPSILVIGGVTIGMFAIHYLIGLGAIVAIVVLFVIGYIIGSKRERTQRIDVQPPATNYNKINYVNHCWKCGKEIDSHKDKLCNRCGKHYICSNCGMCWCDDPRNKQQINGGNATNMGLFKTKQERKKEFYFNFRMSKMLFEYLRDGKIEIDTNILSTKNKYVNAIKASREFTKPNGSLFTTEDMLNGLDRFFNSINFVYGKATYDKDALDGIIFQMDTFLKLGFDSDFLETMELEAWFLSVLKATNN